MDASRFDSLVRSFAGTATRRGALAALAAALAALPVLGADARNGGKGKGKGKHRGKGHGKGSAAKAKDRHRKRTKSRQTQTEAVCFGGSACTVGPSGNLTKCDFSNGSALQNATCTSCNLSGANLRQANASNATLKSANLGKACLVDANFTGANLSSANLTGAILCRTTMPNGSINNAGCNKATACCQTCKPLGDSGCGLGGGCCSGGICQGDTCVCPDGRQNCDGACKDLQTDAKHCGVCGNVCAAGQACCGGACLNVQSDDNNCGSCGNVCAAGERCCGGACLSVQSDDKNCGACGIACAATDTCQGGICVCEPAPCAAAGGCCVGDICDFNGGVWEHQTTFGTLGDGKSDFGTPVEIVVSPDGKTAWITDASNQRVSVWADVAGAWTALTPFGTGSDFDGPLGLAVAPDGNTVWVSEANRHRIAIWTRTGPLTWAFVNSFGSFGTGVGRLNSPQGIAVAPGGKSAWVADTSNNRVSVWIDTGLTWSNLITFGGLGTGPSQFDRPTDVAVSPDEKTVWVADQGNHRISVWTDVAGVWTPLTTFGNGPGAGPNQFNTPQGVAVAADGQTAWVVDQNNERISVWVRSGGVWSNQSTFGGSGSGANQFQIPFGVAVAADEQTVWVADTLNSRVSIWARTCPAV